MPSFYAQVINWSFLLDDFFECYNHIKVEALKYWSVLIKKKEEESEEDKLI